MPYCSIHETWPVNQSAPQKAALPTSLAQTSHQLIVELTAVYHAASQIMQSQAEDFTVLAKQDADVLGLDVTMSSPLLVQPLCSLHLQTCLFRRLECQVDLHVTAIENPYADSNVRP